MGWQDRDYSQSSFGGGGGGGGFLDALRRFFSKSFPVGTYLGISVRVHITFLIVLGFMLIPALADGTNQFYWVTRGMSLLFLFVLLHEFGHALACRWVGGSADHILIWPLGGLAYCRAPHRPGAALITTAGGPMVNVVLAVGCYLLLFLVHAKGDPQAMLVSWHPLRPFIRFEWGVWGLVADAFAVNYILLLFNLCLMFYPFDGGRIVQELLWMRIGYQRSMVIATRFGMVGAVVLGLVGLYGGSLMLVLIALFGFQTCYRQGQAVAMGAGGPAGQYFAGDDQGGAPLEQNEGWFARRQQGRAARRRQQELDHRAKLDAEVDRILIKVKQNGLHSLTRSEKRTLEQASQRSRQ